MVHFNARIIGTLAISVAAVQGAPVVKRIAQVITDSTAKWEQACIAAGGAQQCNPISVAAFSTLLAAAGPCAQQDSADAMIDLAKSLNDDPDMINLAQIFAQQPRNTPTSQSVQYCQTAPKNAELNGLFQCQFAGANPTTFVGGVAVGAEGTIPFGLNAPLDPAGSCPANPDGPIADGTQLVDITQNPGSGGNGSADSGNNSSDGTAAGDEAADDSSSPTSTVPATIPSSTPSTGAANGNGFLLQNGQDAQALNAQFASLTRDSACQDGENACVDNGFAQCVGGSFVVSACNTGLTCAALPLVNSPGTSIACTTEADAEARIAATGATGGIVGDGSAATVPVPSTQTSPATGSAAPATSPSTSGGDVKLQNGQAAQQQNAKFATLTSSSTCQDGENACVDGGFAQCIGGSFVVTQCGSGLQCFALPLVNSAGTSITCSTAADAEARIAAAGATGGISG